MSILNDEYEEYQLLQKIDLYGKLRIDFQRLGPKDYLELAYCGIENFQTSHTIKHLKLSNCDFSSLSDLNIEQKFEIHYSSDVELINITCPKMIISESSVKSITDCHLQKLVFVNCNFDMLPIIKGIQSVKFVRCYNSFDLSSLYDCDVVKFIDCDVTKQH